MHEIVESITNAYEFAHSKYDVTDPDRREKYRLMNQCIEQYRRRMYEQIYPFMKKTNLELGRAEIHLNLKGDILDQLQQIEDNDNNFLVYAYYQNEQSGIGQRKNRKEYGKTKGVHRNQPTKTKAHPRAIRDTQ